MDRGVAASILASSWLIVWVYDLVVHLPDNLHSFVAFGWITTIYISLKWPLGKSNSIFLKLVSLAVLTFVIFASFGTAINYLPEISPNFEAKYKVIIMLIVQSILASFFTALVVSVPLVSIFKNSFIIIFAACLPISIIQIHSIYESTSTASQFILGFEILFRLAAIWLVCKIVSKALTMRLSGTRQNTPRPLT